MAKIRYDAEIRHDGRLHSFTIPNLEIPACRSCGEKVFTEQVDSQVNAALRLHLKLLTPEEMRAALNRVDMSQKEAADRLGIAEATLSRWLNHTQIQSRAMDNFLRVFFSCPRVRTELHREGRNLHLGAADVVERQQPEAQSENLQAKSNSWLDALNGRREQYRIAQEYVLQAGTTWGKRRVA